MPDLTITLRGAAADKLRKLVAEERYDRPEDAIADALEALDSSRDTALDDWLRGTIAERADAIERDRSRLLTPDQVRDQLLGKS